MLKKINAKDITPEYIERFNLVFNRVFTVENTINVVNDPNYFFYVDTKKNEFVGYFYGYFLRGTQRTEWFTHLWTIQIVDKFQRKGLGTTYIEKIKEISRKKGSRAILLITQDDDDTALKFYAKVGGKQSNGELDRVVWIMSGLEQ